MSKLIQMRQRIKAIETIKKITHAMRLISMSAHSQLKNKQQPLNHYKQQLTSLFFKIKQLDPKWSNSILQSPETTEKKTLIILVGSQKGLCGNFNTSLFHLFDKEIKTYANVSIALIAVGQKAVDHVINMKIGTIIESYAKFTTQTLFTIAQSISSKIIQESPSYTSVVVFSNLFKSFFLQKPYATTLIPLVEQEEQSEPLENTIDDYAWEQDPQIILDILVQQYVEAQIQYTLFESLLAEHAARFISMDNSTRNANNLLEKTKLDYNKLRQAKITLELTELTGSFE